MNIGRLSRTLAFASAVKDHHLVCLTHCGLQLNSSAQGVAISLKQLGTRVIGGQSGTAIGAIVVVVPLTGFWPLDSEGLSKGCETGGTASSIPGAGSVEGTSLIASLVLPEELSAMGDRLGRSERFGFFRDPVQ